jgi:hypothetical protein
MFESGTVSGLCVPGVYWLIPSSRSRIVPESNVHNIPLSLLLRCIPSITRPCGYRTSPCPRSQCGRRDHLSVLLGIECSSPSARRRSDTHDHVATTFDVNHSNCKTLSSQQPRPSKILHTIIPFLHIPLPTSNLPLRRRHSIWRLCCIRHLILAYDSLHNLCFCARTPHSVVEVGNGVFGVLRAECLGVGERVQEGDVIKESC